VGLCVVVVSFHSKVGFIVDLVAIIVLLEIVEIWAGVPCVGGVKVGTVARVVSAESGMGWYSLVQGGMAKCGQVQTELVSSKTVPGPHLNLKIL